MKSMLEVPYNFVSRKTMSVEWLLKGVQFILNTKESHLVHKHLNYLPALTEEQLKEPPL